MIKNIINAGIVVAGLAGLVGCGSTEKRNESKDSEGKFKVEVVVSDLNRNGTEDVVVCAYEKKPANSTVFVFVEYKRLPDEIIRLPILVGETELLADHEIKIGVNDVNNDGLPDITIAQYKRDEIRHNYEQSGRPSGIKTTVFRNWGYTFVRDQ